MPTGGTSVLGSKLATWRANPRTSLNRSAQDAWTIGRQRCPFHCQLRRDDPGFALLHEGDEVGEPTGLVLVLVSKPLTHAQVLIECGAQIGHCTPPGQGRLNVLNASMSTFA
jgi:hypothetical protein